MNENEFDRTARVWLDDGPTRMSDRALLSALAEIHTTRQRRALRPAWRAAPVSIFARVATAAVLVVAVSLVAINVVPSPSDRPSVGGPSPSPSASAAVDFPMTSTFVSPTYGFSFKYLDRGGLRPATELWDPVRQQADINLDGAFDAVETGLSAYFEAASVKLPDGVSIDAWVDQYVTPTAAGGCGVARGRQAEITIDGQSGRVAECHNGDPDRVQATVVAGGRLYLFILSAARSDARALFDAWIATIDLRPEDAAVPSNSPSS
jgi:hypothetical protein